MNELCDKGADVRILCRVPKVSVCDKGAYITIMCRVPKDYVCDKGTYVRQCVGCQKNHHPTFNHMRHLTKMTIIIS
jgi:hypothetical protein